MNGVCGFGVVASEMSSFGSGGVRGLSTGAQKSAECGLYHKGFSLGWFSFLKIPTVKLDLVSEINCIAELPGRLLVESPPMMKLWCQRQELVLRRVGTKGTKTESTGFGGELGLDSCYRELFYVVPRLCRLGGRLLERAGAAEHFRRKWVKLAGWGGHGVRDDAA